jgi:hypothetical protein
MEVKMGTAIEKIKTREEKDDLEESMKLLLNKACNRCGGLMITEQCLDVESNTGEFEIEIRKCISCGETIDPTILRNRQRNAQNIQEHSQKGLHFSSLKALTLGY